MIPTTIAPRILSLKNRWRTGVSLRGQFGRDFVLGSFSIAVMGSIYYGLTIALEKAKTGAAVAYFHPSMILDILLIFLYGLLIFSAAVSSIGLLYLSDDMPILRASPISKLKIFLTKLLEATASSTWMVIVFGLPGLLAFGVSYNAGLFFYLTAFLALIPYFIIPAAVSIGAITLFASLIPANRTREILVVTGGVVIAGLYFIVRILLTSDTAPMSDIQDLLNLVQMIRLPNTAWLPTHWAAIVLGQQLAPTGIAASTYFICLWSFAISLSLVAYIIFALCFDRAYSMAQGSSGRGRIQSIFSLTSMPGMSLIYSRQERALLSKDMSVFLRDMTQTIQLMLLLGLCSVYLYNLRILRVVDQLPEAARIWWQGFLVIGNMAMGAFVIAAVCTRFVFPSISLEGRAYWVLRSSPLPLNKILKAKLKIWYFPVSIIGCVLLLSGAFAIQAEPQVVIISGLMSWVVCIGIVGLGVGLGSVYANFDWEHTSQLAASFGSLIYMLSSTVLIALNLVPVTILFMMRNMKILNYSISDTDWYICIASCIAFLIYLNFVTARWALKIGEQSLLQREK